MFSSNSILNLNLIPKGKLFIMSHSTLMQRFEEFGAQEGSILSIANMSKFEKQKNFCLSELGLARWNSGPG
jgi:hypothetical protein